MSHFIEAIQRDPDFCRRHAKQKPGRGSQPYVPWAILYATAVTIHPALEYEYPEPRTYGGTIEVGCRVRVSRDEPWRETWLAVTDGRNAPVAEPAATDVQNTRQRALAKALSLATGIGLTLWFGGDQVDAVAQQAPPREVSAAFTPPTEGIDLRQQVIPNHATKRERWCDLGAEHARWLADAAEGNLEANSPAMRTLFDSEWFGAHAAERLAQLRREGVEVEE